VRAELVAVVDSLLPAAVLISGTALNAVLVVDPLVRLGVLAVLSRNGPTSVAGARVNTVVVGELNFVGPLTPYKLISPVNGVLHSVKSRRLKGVFGPIAIAVFSKALSPIVSMNSQVFKTFPRELAIAASTVS
jgi:hypothetical protein